eukprot:TRINITY_DN44410_c0_g1_i1.p1 TRINITY_DN44410_c0_g1~~TRINITY_DN44410_c0_g1_i1.p1  ORF type:complete len:465 (+),score=112.43 TRINITY_DN44410_c0_g1_i1:60-1454(+)
MRAAGALLFAVGASAYLQCDVSFPRPVFQNFSQPIYHDDASKGSFNQRIQVIDHYYKPGGPVLYYVGPENAWMWATVVCLNLPEHAKALGAAIIGAEHRFFGESHPVSKDWAPLTLDNVLADYAAVISSFTGTGGKYAGAKVITYGGSYGGFLSMMMKVNYPKLVTGSIASAAPAYLLGSGIPDGTWYDTVADIYTAQDSTCATAVSGAFKQVSDMLAAGDYDKLKTELNLCQAPNQTYGLAMQLYLAHGAQVVTQFNYPSPAANKDGFPFQKVCGAFASGGAMPGLLSMLQESYNKSGIKCFWPLRAASAADEVALHSAHAVASRPKLGDINFALSWYRITCDYFVMPIAGGDKASAFLHFDHRFDYDGIANYCQKTFGVKPRQTPQFLPSQLNNATNIVMSNMGYDPVYGFSIRKNVSDSVSLLWIPKAGHTQDIVAPDTMDLPDVVKARNQELSTIRQWIA